MSEKSRQPVNLIRYGSTTENIQKSVTYNPFADYKNKMEGKESD